MKSTYLLTAIFLIIFIIHTQAATNTTNSTNSSTSSNYTYYTWEEMLDMNDYKQNFSIIKSYNLALVIVKALFSEGITISKSSSFFQDSKIKIFQILLNSGFITGNGAYFLALAAIFCMAFTIEVLNFFRFNIQAKIFIDLNPQYSFQILIFEHRLIEYEHETIHIPIKQKLIIGLLYMISCILSYLLLLLVFSLDLGVFLSILFGYTIGFGIFGFRRRKSYIYLYNPKSDKCQFEIES